MSTKVKETKVRFMYNETREDLYAYFPQIKFSSNGYRKDLKTCYSHVGQHSSCAIGYVNASRPATEAEYADLKKELESIGYVLKIIE